MNFHSNRMITIQINGTEMLLDTRDNAVYVGGASLTNYIHYYIQHSHKDLVYQDKDNDRYIVLFLARSNKNNPTLQYVIFDNISNRQYDRAYLDTHCELLESVIDTF